MQPPSAGALPALAGSSFLFAAPGLAAGGETNLQLTEPLLWLMIGISTAGALVTFSFLVYTLWKFRDPSMRWKRHG